VKHPVNHKPAGARLEDLGPLGVLARENGKTGGLLQRRKVARKELGEKLFETFLPGHGGVERDAVIVEPRVPRGQGGCCGGSGDTTRALRGADCGIGNPKSAIRNPRPPVILSEQIRHGTYESAHLARHTGRGRPLATARRRKEENEKDSVVACRGMGPPAVGQASCP